LNSLYKNYCNVGVLQLGELPGLAFYSWRWGINKTEESSCLISSSNSSDPINSTELDSSKSEAEC
jgi:hypothetical protein